MTPRQRLFAALAGEPTDHVPVWLLFPYHATGYYVDVRRQRSYRPLFERSLTQAVTLNRRNLRAPVHGPGVHARQEQHTVDGLRVLRNTLSCGSLRLYSQSCATDANLRRPLLNDAADLEAFCRLPLETDPGRIHAALDAQLPNYLNEAAEFPAALGAMMLDLGEPIGPLYSASNLEEYAIWSITHGDLIESWLQRAMERVRTIYRYCLERELADLYFLVGSELASPPLVSRRTFQRWIVPFASELIQLVQAYGKKVIQHYHGQIHGILAEFALMAPDGLHTIEAPPIGDCTFAQAYSVIGDGMTLIGNIQYDDFRAATPGGMRNAVHAVLDECRGRRLILSPSAGPFDPRPGRRLLDNYAVFMQAAWEHGEWH
jgi:hypothetical protein